MLVDALLESSLLMAGFEKWNPYGMVSDGRRRTPFTERERDQLMGLFTMAGIAFLVACFVVLLIFAPK